MKKIVGLGLVLAVAFGLSACGDDATDSSNSAEPAKSAANTKSSSSTVESSETVKDSQKEEEAESDLAKDGVAKYTTDWSDDWEGLKFSIPEVAITKTNDQDREDMMTEGEGIMGVKFVLENTTDHDFDTYPDQATAVVNGQQIEAEMFTSEDIGGDILSGVKKEGLVVFDIPKLDDPAAVKEIRLKWNASNHDSEDIENMYHDFDVTITLK